MRISRAESAKSAADLRIISDYQSQDSDLSDSGSRTREPNRRYSATRLERDRERGYSINVKQVVLAFGVEFLIIGLILISQILYAIDSAAGSQYKFYSALLFPTALAAVELARVPLAIAVRTQTSWNIQFAALIGVGCAVAVTSVSLYQIGHYTFNPRLERAYEKRALVQTAEESLKAFADRKKAAETVAEQKHNDWTAMSERYKALASQLNAQPAQSCNAINKRNPDGTESQVQACRVNPALKPLQTEIAETKVKLTELETSAKQAQAEAVKLDPAQFEQAVQTAKKDYRDALQQSPLHSYTGMLFSKDPAEASEGEVKTLERYLILIPAIAAALSSTLIAMTAVRRLKPVAPEPETSIPDEAAAYLFGPLVAAIRSEAKEAVAAALNPSGRPGMSSANPPQAKMA